MKMLTKIICMFLSMAICIPAFAVEKVYFVYTDPVGTPLAMTNNDGAIVWKAEYKPFGEIQSEIDFVSNNKKFVGKELDAESGLYYFGARYMEARIGRFISPDPVGAVDSKTSNINNNLLINPQRLNYYTYCMNNPSKYIDPDGYDVWFIGFNFGGFISEKFNKIGRGIGMQVEYGFAYDTNTNKIMEYKSKGAADPKNIDDQVGGYSIGPSLNLGVINDANFSDFFGKSRNITENWFVIGKTNIKTSSGKEGFSVSGGLKSEGIGIVDITTITTPREQNKQNKQELLVPPAP